MKLMEKKSLYVSDLDQTLLSSDGYIAAKTAQDLNSMILEGLEFTVASARSIWSMKTALRGLELRMPVIELNGACISDWNSGAHLHSNTIAWSLGHEIFDMGKKYRLNSYFSTTDNCVDRLYTPEIQNPGQQWYLDDRMNHHDPRLQKDPWSPEREGAEEILSIAFIARKEELEGLHNDLHRISQGNLSMHFNINQYDPPWYWLTLQSHLAQKHIALRQLMEMEKMDDQELVVFGDEVNDIGLFKEADRSIAVENAIPELHEIAHEVIGHHNDHSVLDFIVKEWQKGK